jgi:hypothetical protein
VFLSDAHDQHELTFNQSPRDIFPLSVQIAGNPAEVRFSLVPRDLNRSLRIRCPRLARSDYLSAL